MKTDENPEKDKKIKKLKKLYDMRYAMSMIEEGASKLEDISDVPDLYENILKTKKRLRDLIYNLENEIDEA